MPVYTNVTATTNASNLTLNISISDLASILAQSWCVINVNGTNFTVALSGVWCNTTAVNLTGTTGSVGSGLGNTNILVYDVLNYSNGTTGFNASVGLNNSYYVFMDSLAPTVSATCSPSSLASGQPFPCSCSATDPAKGNVSSSSSSTSGTTTSTAGELGIFTYSCGATNLAGLSGSSSATYTVWGNGPGAGYTGHIYNAGSTIPPAPTANNTNISNQTTNNNQTSPPPNQPQSNNLFVNVWNAIANFFRNLFG